jgi:ribose 5-phosphate isomerase B
LKNIIIASDHAGFELKKHLIQHLKNTKENIIYDLGTNSAKSVDYPDYAQNLAVKMLDLEDSLGILLCGSGLGISMAANRFSHIRAALCLNEEMAELARRHNNANVLVLGARLLAEDHAIKIMERFFIQEFDANRHLKRVNKLSKLPA